MVPMRQSWLAELGHLGSVEKVLILARLYLDEWTPAEIAVLPPGAWPRRPECLDDLVRAALVLEGVYASLPAREAPRVLHELLVFLAQLSIRGLQLELGPPSSRPVPREKT